MAMLEIEQKFRVSDPAALVERLAGLGVQLGAAHGESDHYMNAPDRDFAQTGEAFRLRRIAEQNFLTFKGRKDPGPVKVREELELPLPPGDEAAEQYLKLFGLLGYRFVAVVRKQRRSGPYQREGFELTLCLDEVEGLGGFCEIEILAERDKLDRARTIVETVARELGLTTLEPRSYLGMVLGTQT
jgi:adenylate cyclase class 2